MSDIFQEVEEDLRRERMKVLWDRYGIFVIAVAVLIVVITAGYRGYDAWKTGQSRTAGDAFAAALVEVDEARTASAADALIAFGEGAPAGYAMLAEFRAASAFLEAEEGERAVDIFRALATDGSVPPLYQDLARIRLAQTLIDLGQSGEAQEAVAPMAGDASNAFNKSAQELMGLAAYAADDTAEAQRWFVTLRDAAGTPPASRARADLMLALLAQSTTLGDGSAVDAAAPASASEETN